MSTDDSTDRPHQDPDAAGEQERADEGMAPLVNNTGDDTDEAAPTG